jgi:hypothetical protein
MLFCLNSVECLGPLCLACQTCNKLINRISIWINILLINWKVKEQVAAWHTAHEIFWYVIYLRTILLYLLAGKRIFLAFIK